jgi:hypothetical protein
LLRGIGKLRRWHPGYNPGDTHAYHDFSSRQVSHYLTWYPPISLLRHAAPCCLSCRFHELFIGVCELLEELFL